VIQSGPLPESTPGASSMDEGQQALAALLGLSTSVKAGPNGLEVDVGRKGARRMSAAGEGASS